MALNAEAIIKRALVTPAAMGVADKRTIDAGTPQGALVARAARAAFRVLRSHFVRQPVTVLCGPGNNGEDGLMLAALLDEAGWPLSVILPDGDADLAATDLRSLTPRIRPSGTFSPGPGMLVVDALFGAGLSRPLEGEAKALIERLEGSGAAVCAIDLPSGLDGRTGEVLGLAPRADVTVTFHRLKPGHLLGAGPERCGQVFLADIGIAAEASDAAALHNDPSLWAHLLSAGSRDTHKYRRGHVAVFGGPGLRGGAARLAARGASVSGCGAVTYLSPVSAAEFAAASFDAVMVRQVASPDDVGAHLSDKVTSVVIGPGMGQGELARAVLDRVLETKIPAVLDADALTLYEATPDTLFKKVHQKVVMTPHEGEFARLFKGIEGDALTRTVAAGKRAGATVLLKGATTVIAGPRALPVLNTNAGPALATAGSGDVLAGVIGGLLAQGLEPQEAAAAAAWLHGEAGRQAPPSLNADDLPARIAAALASVRR